MRCNLSSAQTQTYSKIDYMAGHKASLYKFKKKKCTYTSSDYSGTELEINIKRDSQNHTNTWKLNKSLLNDFWINKNVRQKII